MTEVRPPSLRAFTLVEAIATIVVLAVLSAVAANKWHPINKTIELGVANGWGAIWYNAANGGLRLRVPQQATDAAAISLYNRVNGTRITSLAQTTP